MVPASHPRSLGDFRIEAVLGEGGSGVVYDATWGPRRVALKVVHESLAGNDRLRAQFMSEAQRLQTIAHPSVVKVLAVGVLPDGRPYLAMERLEGESLAQVLARGPLPMAYALALFGELCAAVATLHEQGLVHRDLKPENVFIVGGAHAVLLDFGIAKELAAPASTTTMDGGVRGTPAYMAPERFFGQAAGVATDIYELAVILYAMLAGRLPWDDLGDPEARLSPRPLVELALVPPELDVAIRLALSTRAQNRPATAHALRESVEHAAAGQAGGPTAGETARMRPQTGEQRPPRATQQVSQPAGDRAVADTQLASGAQHAGRPWFAQRTNTTDRGKTPLAWAPTQLAEQAPPEAPPHRTRWLAGGVAVVALAGAALVWRLTRDDGPAAPSAPSAAIVPAASAPRAPAPATPTSTEHDPWGSPPPTGPPPELVLSGPEVPLATAQAELAAAIPHLPPDTSVVLGATVAEFRRDERFERIFTKMAAMPQANMYGVLVPDCIKMLVAKSEWVVLGSPGFSAFDKGTMIVRGRFGRDDVQRCFVGSRPHEVPDGSSLLRLDGGNGWVDFLDEHTAYISVRDDLDAVTVHANARATGGLTKRARTLLASLPADRMVTFVVDGANKLQWVGEGIPAGTDGAGWLRITKVGLDLWFALDLPTEADAKRLVAAVRPQIETVFSGATTASGKVTVTHDAARFLLAGNASTTMLGMVTSALSMVSP